MNSLPIFVRLSGNPVILIGDGEAADAKRRLLERAGALAVREENEDARLAIVADGDEAVVRRLQARGVLVNAVDRPDWCDFTLPAIVDRDPVLVAIGTGGASAGLAKALRQRLETLLPASLGALARALHDARPALRARWPDATERRRAIDAALTGPLDVLIEHDPAAIESALAGGTADPARRVEIMLRTDDPDDLTLREARWLAQADLVLYGPAVPAAVLDRARADAARRPLESAGDEGGFMVIVRSPG